MVYSKKNLVEHGIVKKHGKTWFTVNIIYCKKPK